MGLKEGQELGPYRILGTLGAGGMGEVYRARDTRLDRDVAIKVLPRVLADDPDSLARFEREAKAVAALSHPNILAIHDFGKDDEGRAYTVTELLEGGTLRQRLATGAMPPRKAVEIATQIARGLGAAHEKGVIHRDLKPENIIVTRDGQAKILDFGLAAREESAPADLTQTPTRTSLTEPGTVMGTVGYMSPEQVRGEPADARSDIFSFGAVLYEMLGGVRAFARETTPETMTAILREEPAPADIPAGLDTLVRRCLEKEPEERFHSARDLAFALQALADPSSTRHQAVAPGPAPARRMRWIGLAAGAALVAAAFLAGRWTGGGGASAEAGMRLEQLTFDAGVESQPSVSPDGRSFVFVAARGNEDLDIYLQRVGGETAINLTANCDNADQQPAFSPDGEQIAFRSEREGGGIFIMGATGESVRRVTDFGFNPAWSPDGRFLAVGAEGVTRPYSRATRSKLWIVEVETGERRELPVGDGVQPDFSPDGSRLAYWGLPQGQGTRMLFTIPVDGGDDPVSLSDDSYMNWNPRWSPDGRWLYFASDRDGPMNLWRLPMAGGSSVGPAQRVTSSTQGFWAFDIAPGGSLLFAAGVNRDTVRRQRLDRATWKLQGEPEVLFDGSRDLGRLQVSPDGRWIVMNTVLGEQEDLFLAASDGSELRRLTNDRFKDRSPIWSGGSDDILFFSDRSGRYEIWRIRRDGSGLEQVTDIPDRQSVEPLPSPDGTRMVVRSIGMGDPALVDLTASWPIREVAPIPGIRPGDFPGGAILDWSPDGRFLFAVIGGGAYRLDPGTGERELIAEGVQPVQAIDDRYLLGIGPNGLVVIDLRGGGIIEMTDKLDFGAGFPKVGPDGFLYEAVISTAADIWLLRSTGAED